MRKVFGNLWKFMKAVMSCIRAFMIIGMLVIGTATIYFISTAYQVTVNQYKESLIWESTAYEEPLAQVEPALVSNIVDTDAVAAADAWNAVEDYVAGLDGQPLDRGTASAILGRAAKWQEAYGLNSDAFVRLSLYLEAESAIEDAYATLDTKRLSELAMSLYILELNGKTTAGQQYMERFAQVASDFDVVKNVMADTVLSVGTFKDGIWTIPYTYDQGDIKDVSGKIGAMQKFPLLYDTAGVLSDITKVLNYNKNARDYFAYRSFRDKICSMKRSDYIAVSSIYTYGQALSYGLRTNVQPGKAVSPESPVSGIYHKGRKLDDSQYIRKGADVMVQVDAIYEPEPPSVTEPDIQPHTETPSPAPAGTMAPEATKKPAASPDAKPETSDGAVSPAGQRPEISEKPNNGKEEENEQGE